MDIKSDFLKEIGKRISELRLKNNQTQNDLSFLTGLEKSEISKYEKGKINLTMTTLLKLAAALKVHPKELLIFEFNIEKYKIDY
ncbi:helix-turn-helix domain-containing protein [Galbibacter mesophilus]|uniref:helix-turn-helix domain-containing protein n=1 Tax=Galbibacter mesophilus TaxID=379069 RepID=UPI00191DB85C|nr:helix-turn-helix transcriptional regulator [Galbibacter mesophilus]MCM5663660.1 helix-turn-helix domain-containing protein [Galbibacter mesophilus]